MAEKPEQVAQTAQAAQAAVEEAAHPLDAATVSQRASGTLDPSTTSESKEKGGLISVVAAIAANIAVGIVKFIAAGISGSAAMVSEGIHSIVDSGNGFLILLGMHKAKKRPTVEHPFGFGKELYFWCLVVAVSIFMLGGGASIMQGVDSIIEVHSGQYQPGDPLMSYIVLIIAMAIEGFSMSVALREFNKARGDTPPLKFIHDCKDPSVYSVLLEDTAAELGLVFAFIGLLLSSITGNHYFDGGASVLIGLLLMAVSIVLLRESKGLLLGEGMTREQLAEARAIIESEPEVEKAGRILTMYFGPESMLMTVDATFKPQYSADQILSAVDRIEQKLVWRFPETTRIFIEAENLANVERQRQIISTMPTE